jgi:hypothetical protein
MDKNEMNKDAIHTIRQLWYQENNKDTTNMDKREIAIHVGKKSGLIMAMNALQVVSPLSMAPEIREQ